LNELDIGEREAPGKDDITVEVEVDNLEDEGNEAVQRVSIDHMEYNATVECRELIVAQKTG